MSALGLFTGQMSWSLMSWSLIAGGRFDCLYQRGALYGASLILVPKDRDGDDDFNQYKEKVSCLVCSKRGHQVLAVGTLNPKP